MSFSLSSREQKTISNVRRLFEHASKQHKQRKARKTIQNQLRQILLRRKRKPASILLLLFCTSLLSVQRDEGPAFSSPSLAVPASGLPDFKKKYSQHKPATTAAEMLAGLETIFGPAADRTGERFPSQGFAASTSISTQISKTGLQIQCVRLQAYGQCKGKKKGATAVSWYFAPMCAQYFHCIH